MSETKGKRMVADTGYEVIHAMRIGDSEILVAENMNDSAGCHYMKVEYSDNGIIGQYDRAFYSSDYCAVMDAYISSIDQQLKRIRAEIVHADYQHTPITAADCYQHDYSQDISGKVVAIKAESLRPEYRRGDRQMVLVDGGFGTKNNARGSAVFCYHLYNGEHTRFERHDVLGIVRVLPAWAVERLDEMERIIDERRSPQLTANGKETVAGYTITERIQVGDKLFVMGENPNAVSPFVTWQHLEGRPGYDNGNYFLTCRRAMIDLHARAKKERETITGLDRSRNTKTRDEAR
jgi:hypothetical protein